VKIAVTTNGKDLDALISPIFGRCSTYILVDTDTMQFQVLENPAIGAPGGAGIQAAQFVAGRGAQAIVTGNVGPNAFGVLKAANLSVYLLTDVTVRQAVEAYKAGQLTEIDGASVPAHVGMGRGMGRRRGGR
jgi:predicted Fe-Mo cluster-binding NifX family protein